MHPSRPRAIVQHPAVAVLLITALLLALSGTSSWAVPSQGELDAAKEQADRLEGAVANAETELAEVRAELEELEAQLVTAEAKLAASTARYRAAEVAATAASDRARAAEGELEVAELELEDNRETLSGLARDTFKYGAQAGSAAMAAFEMMDGPSEGLADRLHYLQRGVGVRTAALQASDALQVRVTHLTERAREEEEELQFHQAEAEIERSASAALYAEVEDLTDRAADNAERAAALVAVLEGEQQDVEVRITQLEQQVAQEREEAERRERERLEKLRLAREAREQAAREQAAREQEERQQAARDRAAREQAEQEAAERQRRQEATVSAPAPSSSSSGSSSGGSSGSSSSGSSGGSSGGGSVSNSPGPTPSLRTVGGITVASSLAPQLEALLNAARADGIVLGGHGYRSPEVTARLRVTNGCRDVYNAPASSCRVPTARPGTSEHEKGLAVDFTYQGQTICFPRSSANCSGNAGFTWLRNNAGSYGLRNLSTEAWHWSTTGR